MLRIADGGDTEGAEFQHNSHHAWPSYGTEGRDNPTVFF